MANVVITPTLLTRPNDTTLYTVGDGIAALTASAVLQEMPLASATASGVTVLDKLQIVTSQKACQGGLRVHFYTASTVSAAGIIEDNAVYTLLTADQALYQGYVDMDAFNTEDTTSTFAMTMLRNIGLLLTSDAAKSVWFAFQLKTGAFTPDALQTFRTTAWFVQ